MDEEKALQTIWDYMNYDSELMKADLLVVFGSNDLSVTIRGAELYLEGYAPLILFTGGLGKGTLGKWTSTESEKFAKIALDKGVPMDNIMIEAESTNTGENICYSKRLLNEKKLQLKVSLVYKNHLWIECIQIIQCGVQGN